MLYELPVVDFEDPTVFLEQNSIGKRSKGFKASGFPCCILNNTHFFLNWSRKSEKNS